MPVKHIRVMGVLYSVCTEVPGIVLQYTAALSSVHQDRNNSLDYVCVDWSRVVLDPVVEGVDYINASWTPGYSGPTDFIISQHPVPNTLHQFWSMVWQTGTKIIVCLSVIPHQFWPVMQVPLILPGTFHFLKGPSLKRWQCQICNDF